MGIAKLPLLQEKTAINQNSKDIADNRENQKRVGERFKYLRPLLIVVDQARHGQKRDEGECQPTVHENSFAAVPPDAERHRKAEAEGEPKQSLPDIGSQRDLEPPAQDRHGEYDVVSNAGNVQVSELHIKNAAKSQEDENQQNAEPQKLERRGFIGRNGHWRTSLRREGEGLILLCGSVHSGNCLHSEAGASDCL